MFFFTRRFRLFDNIFELLEECALLIVILHFFTALVGKNGPHTVKGVPSACVRMLGLNVFFATKQKAFFHTPVRASSFEAFSSGCVRARFCGQGEGISHTHSFKCHVNETIRI